MGLQTQAVPEGGEPGRCTVGPVAADKPLEVEEDATAQQRGLPVHGGAPVRAETRPEAPGAGADLGAEAEGGGGGGRRVHKGVGLQAV